MNIGSVAVRLYNQLSPGQPLSTSAWMQQRAEQETGLDNWGTLPIQPAFMILVDALIREARLSPFGWWLIKRQLLDCLKKRLRLERQYQHAQDLPAFPMPPQVFITGLPRTGTTMLHRLLSQDPLFRSFAAWELENPVPPANPAPYQSDLRRRRHQINRALFNYCMISGHGRNLLQAHHQGGSHLPAECWPLFQSTFHCQIFPLCFHVPSYAGWLRKQDMLPIYRDYQKQLQILTSHFSGSRLLLKYPGHLSYGRELSTVFPQACILRTHRHFPEVFVSICRLIELSRSIASDAVEPYTIGRELLEKIAATADAFPSNEAAWNSLQCLNISYRRLVLQPLDEVRRIYEFLELKLSASAEAAMKAWLELNHKNRPLSQHGVNLEYYGVTQAEISEYSQGYSLLFQEWTHGE